MADLEDFDQTRKIVVKRQVKAKPVGKSAIPTSPPTWLAGQIPTAAIPKENVSLNNQTGFKESALLSPVFAETTGSSPFLAVDNRVENKLPENEAVENAPSRFEALKICSLYLGSFLLAGAVMAGCLYLLNS